MCGISGYISKKKLVRDNGVKSTLALMGRRGPDAQKYFTSKVGDKELSMIHSRLSIIDVVDRSDQPFIDGHLTLIFNGEIYNYKELKNELKDKYIFKTNSDTEVLIKCFKEYGEKCVDHFIGMWAFAIWNEKTKELFLSRDNFGEKPLYYFFCDEGFFFGSEIKFIKSLCNKNFKINSDLINKNLFLGYKSLNKKNESFYKEIKLLENSTNIKVNLDLNLKSKKYWIPEGNVDKNLNKNEINEIFKQKITKSLKFRLRSDVPLAFCLSGGIDSGSLTSIASKILNREIHTFSIIDEDQRYNEEENIRLVTKDLNCASYLIRLGKNKENFFKRMRELVKYHDGPLATISYYVHSFLSEEISKKGFKVSISGTGADEILTGYYDHNLLHLATLREGECYEENLEYWKNYILPNIRNPFLKDPNLYIKNPNDRSLVYEENLNIIDYSNQNFKYLFEEEKYSSELLRNRMLNELFHEVVPVILKHDDLNSMYYSVENRSPFLDKSLLEFTLKIPPELLISKGFQKKILRDSVKDILIDKVRLNRQKKGFNASINSIINLKDPEILKNIFDMNSPISEFVNLKKLKNELNFNEIPNHMSKFIFSIIGTNFFLEDNL